ncbi:MAG: hypothetical protein QOD93_5378 [Acetobacteraceae bacterium]|jgi:hypothetical protein|nr:hypothetical protein [Acetobacteraceae bacterium]
MLAASPNMPQHLPQYDEAVMALGTGSSRATEEGVNADQVGPTSGQRDRRSQHRDPAGHHGGRLTS